MNSKLEPLVSKLLRDSSHDDLTATIRQIRDHFDVEHVVYHSSTQSADPFLALTYDAAWVTRYLEKDYARIDPVVRGTLHRFTPVDWKELDWSSKTARNFLGEAISTGVGHQGFSVPIRGPGGQFALFTISGAQSDDAWQKFTADNLSDLVLLSYYINQRVLDQTEERVASPSKRLSPREVDALSLLAGGKSRAQIAERLKISEHTLRVYIESARLKLGAQNTTHAVALSLSQGLIIL